MHRLQSRRIASILAAFALTIASSPRLQVATARPAVESVASPAGETAAAAHGLVGNPVETGKGWGSMLGCAACAVAAGITIAGGPAAILVAVNAPGSAVALMACAGTCYEAFQ